MSVPKQSKLLDITVKSGHKAFAPTWDLVNGYKSTTIDEDRYIQTYMAQMRQSYRQHTKNWKTLIQLGQQVNVILVCYCPSKANFCHRYVLAEILEQLGCPLGGEIAEESLVEIPRWAQCYLKSSKRTG